MTSVVTLLGYAVWMGVALALAGFLLWIGSRARSDD